MWLIKNLSALFIPAPAEDGFSSKLVYRIKQADGLEPAWEKRIVELGDGRSVGGITQTMYREQLELGAGLVDVGIWKCLFDRWVANTISALASRGLLRVESAGDLTSDGRTAASRHKTGKPINPQHLPKKE